MGSNSLLEFEREREEERSFFFFLFFLYRYCRFQECRFLEREYNTLNFSFQSFVYHLGLVNPQQVLWFRNVNSVTRP